MAANPKPRIEEHYHVYHAEAEVLSGELQHPIKQPLENYGRVAIEKTRREGHFSESVGETTVEGLISFKAAHTGVSGSLLRNKKDLWGNDHSGWVTLSTSVIEGLNVFEVITADRVVAQVSTEHALTDGHVPKVTFLGTRFENLQIAGYRVQPELELGICGDRPAHDQNYLYDRGFLDRVQQQVAGIAGAKGLPESLKTQYDAEIASIDKLRKGSGQGKGSRNGQSQLQCSLVKSIGPIPIPGVKIFGNVIVIPDFGIVTLAEIEVGIEPPSEPFGQTSSTPGNYFQLNMFNMRLGCVGGGSVKSGSVKANGQSYP
ncbi:MAG TPA: hypothetical protein VLV49_03870 [Terriglobales bacterium]|nr:hypothetical protein [Terriglobales bacterium]